MKKLVIFLSIIALGACEKKAVEKPENLIEKEKMVNILYDAALLQAAENVDASKLIQEGVQPDNFIFKKYAIDSVTFAQSNRYYASDPHNYKKMYGEVFHRLEEEMNELNKASMRESGKKITRSDAPAIQ